MNFILFFVFICIFRFFIANTDYVINKEGNIVFKFKRKSMGRRVIFSL